MTGRNGLKDVFGRTAALVVLAIGLASAMSLRACGESVADAVRAGDFGAVAKALKTVPADVNARDSLGFTPLMNAARYGAARDMKALLDGGADPNARTAGGATAFSFAASDSAKARLLLDHGLVFRGLPGGTTTPLMIAARHPNGYSVTRLLLDRGADVNVRGRLEITPLFLAIYSGDERKVRTLIERGADHRAVRKFDDGTQGVPLLEAIYVSQTDIARFLLRRGADVNASDGFGGHSLSVALLNGNTAIVPELIEHGADLRAAKNIGEVPPIVFAAHNERGSAEMVKLLLGRGADLGVHNDRDETALTWARKRGDTELARFLMTQGAKEPAVARRPELPSNSVQLTAAIRRQAIGPAVEKSVALLQKASNGFLDRETRPESCVSCHHQTLPGIAFGWAAMLGLAVDRSQIERQTKAQTGMWSTRVAKAWELDDPVGGAVENLGYGLLNLSANGHAPDGLTDAMTFYLRNVQLKDGGWDSFRARPPSESTRITSTALAVRSLQAYAPVEPGEKTARREKEARSFFLRQQAFTTEERTFQILGLLWSGADAAALKPLQAGLLKAQRSDGGWSQIPTLESDAYATGQVMLALVLSGGLSVEDGAYTRGAEYLLRTQFDDGSWFVKSRSWPFQTHFATGFPHGRDQWISSSATTWAAMALMVSLDPAGPPAFRVQRQGGSKPVGKDLAESAGRPGRGILEAGMD